MTNALVLMRLSERQESDFKIIFDFKKDKPRNLKQIFGQVLDACFELGLAKVGKASITGIKFSDKINHARL